MWNELNLYGRDNLDDHFYCEIFTHATGVCKHSSLYFSPFTHLWQFWAPCYKSIIHFFCFLRVGELAAPKNDHFSLYCYSFLQTTNMFLSYTINCFLGWVDSQLCSFIFPLLLSIFVAVLFGDVVVVIYFT